MLEAKDQAIKLMSKEYLKKKLTIVFVAKVSRFEPEERNYFESCPINCLT